MELHSVLIVGLTGGIGSGKSSCCAAFSRLGITIIDTDEIAHQLSRPYADANLQIAEQFGANALLPDHSLNRKWLRQHILTDAYEKKRLEAIFHPKILDQVKEKILGICAKERYCIIDVPLLFETSSFLNLIDYSIVIDCDEQEQIKQGRKCQNTPPAFKPADNQKIEKYENTNNSCHCNCNFEFWKLSNYITD